MQNKKAVIIMSGGMDSTVLLYLLKAQGYNVYGLSFDYGQRHNKELVYAAYFGKELCEDWKLINLDFMKSIASNSALLDTSQEIPEEHYTNENQQVTVVPNRNMLMLSIAVAYAENLDGADVFFGAHINDDTIYPDCREVFVNSVNETSQLATYNKIKVKAPFVGIEKYQIAKLGDKLKVPFYLTWSCYKGGVKHCGKCATCQERIEAFKLAGVDDPTIYEE